MVKAFIPQSYMDGFYRGEGRFNDIKVKSKGYFNVNASKIEFIDLKWEFKLNIVFFLRSSTADITVVTRTEGDIITVNGKEYLKLTKFDCSPQFGDLKVNATGLFPDPELSTWDFWNYFFRLF